MIRATIGASLILTAVFLFCSGRFIEKVEDSVFLRQEPYFESPIATADQTLTLRKDSFGKGHFGASRNNGRTHQGIDLLSAVGDPVMTVKSGRVVFAGEEKGYGNVVKILHPSGEWLSVYAHLSRINVKEGAWVKQGFVIGNTGKTGNANDPKILPHLHFELRSFEIPKDPTSLLDPSIHILKKY